MNTPAWFQLHLKISERETELFEQALLECGAVSVTLSSNSEQPVLEPGVGEMPLWEKLRLSALFPGNIDTDTILLMLSSRLGSLPPWSWETLVDEAWERRWMEHFEPISCGQRLWICPSWSRPPEPEAINLMLDPGMAFGTGSHATTFMCLQWLDGLALQGKTLIDYGCGSGILAIAAALLGARKVIAIDNDPQALSATRDNAERNGIDQNQLVVCAPEAQAPGTVDYLVANILAAPLIELAEHLCASTKAGGQLCLSGIIDSQPELIREAYAPYVEFDPAVYRDEWVRLCATKNRRC